MNGFVYYTSPCKDSGSEFGKWSMNVSIVGDNGLVKKKDSLEKTLAKKQQSLENILDNKKQSPGKIPNGLTDGQHDLKNPSLEKIQPYRHEQKMKRHKRRDLKLSVRYVNIVKHSAISISTTFTFLPKDP